MAEAKGGHFKVCGGPDPFCGYATNNLSRTTCPICSGPLVEVHPIVAVAPTKEAVLAKVKALEEVKG